MPLTLACSPEVEFRRLATSEPQAGALDTSCGTRTTNDELAPKQVGMARPAGPLTDIVEEWGMQSFPASDPPMNW